MGKQIGREVMMVSRDSHPEEEVHNSHLSQWRYVSADKVKPRDQFISTSLVLHDHLLCVRFHARTGDTAKEDPWLSFKEFPVGG